MRTILAILFALNSLWPHLACAEDLYKEQFRPQYHFSPPQRWMNDPNGMVYFGGEYHLFYQYHPYGDKWGPMHWGHAVSKDMVHWEHLPIAFFPDNHGAIFSGSAVVDWNNTSGFGSTANPPLVAIFTYHDHLRENLGRIDFQTQGIAYSLDKGRTWTKYEANPVLPNPGVKDFRDPKVSWFEPQRKWIMTLAIADHVSFYSSRDLKHWVHESDFGKEWGAHVGVWECPDLFQMTVEGGNVRKFVLLVSINPGGPNGGSGTQYFVGDFDGNRFVLDADLQNKLRVAGAETQAALWLDYGADNYAGVTWSGVPESDGRRLFLGWMNNWAYAQDVPTKRWRGATTIPRQLKLVRTARGLEVHSAPVVELDSLRTPGVGISKRKVKQETDLTQLSKTNTGLREVHLNLKTNRAGVISVSFRNSKGEATVFRINRNARRYELDRSASGAVEFSQPFSRTQIAPLLGSEDSVSLRIYLDHSSVEIFVNDGELVLSNLVFPDTPYDTIVLSADAEISLESGMIHELKSIWNQPVERAKEPTVSGAKANA